MNYKSRRYGPAKALEPQQPGALHGGALTDPLSNWSSRTARGTIRFGNAPLWDMESSNNSMNYRYDLRLSDPGGLAIVRMLMFSRTLLKRALRVCGNVGFTAQANRGHALCATHAQRLIDGSSATHRLSRIALTLDMVAQP